MAPNTTVTTKNGATPPPQPPALQQALSNSTTAWQVHLQALFDHAKEWFPDVVWEVYDEDQPNVEIEEVWGHKAIVYARAPPGFQARYFQFRPAPVTSPSPYSASSTPIPAQSSYSLSLGLDFPSRSPSPSPFRGPSPSPSTNTVGPLRLTASMNSALFSNELEYLYTGKGIGEAFEFLFDTSEGRALGDGLTEDDGDGSETRQDKLRRDLVFMWRSRLYSDVRIALDGTFASTNHEATTAVFSSHRFILAARSPYFYAQLITWGVPAPKPGEPLTVSLPGPPFTPASLHFTLGYIYTGTLVFSHRTYDLDTAFAIMRSATYIQIDSLYDEVQARIVQEMMHGLFHAFLEFSEYERVTGGKWGIGGCRCRQCARRAPRILEFAVADDVKNPHLERGARRALVGLFGEGWCTPEFAMLPQKTRDGLIKGLAKRTTPQNLFALLFAANHALEKIENAVDAWAEVSRDMLLAARKFIDRTLCDEAEQCFEQQEWVEMMEADGGRFEDNERITWGLDAVRRGVMDKNAAMVYQVMVSAVLLRSHPSERDQTMLSATSHIRALVEATRMDVVRFLRKRWLGVRQENGFEPLEDWALKEISHEIDVPVEELLIPGVNPAKPATPNSKSGFRQASKADEGESGSMHSTRAGSTMRSVNANGASSRPSDAVSVRSTTRSTLSTGPRNTTSNTTTTRRKLAAYDPRPDSKLTPTSSSASSIAPSFRSAAERNSVASSLRSTSAASSSRVRKQAPPAIVTGGDGNDDASTPRSSVASMHSVRSKASTVRKSSATSAGLGVDRPTSNVSTASDASTAFKTASEASQPDPDVTITPPSETPSKPSNAASSSRVRRTSSSTTSTHSVRNSRTSVPSQSMPSTPVLASGRRSVASSVTSSVRSRKVTPSRLTPTSAESTIKRGLAVQRSVSSASSKSNASMRSTLSTASSAAKKATPRKASTDSSTSNLKSSNASITSSIRSSRASVTSTASSRASRSNVSSTPPTASAAIVKGKGKAKATSTISERSEHSDRSSIATDYAANMPPPLPPKAGATPMEFEVSESTIQRKSSADTIRESRYIDGQAETSPPSSIHGHLEPRGPQGITLDIGIPCIISSKRAKFRALARYIGEVAGERGPWVGVEIPVSDTWTEDRLEGRQWHDGSWGGVRYFDMGTRDEWDTDVDVERASRRRRMEGSGMMSPGSRTLTLGKRDGDQMSIGMDRSRRFRSESPAISDVSMAESRGLFVRPQQVLYVIDAVGSDF